MLTHILPTQSQTYKKPLIRVGLGLSLFVLLFTQFHDGSLPFYRILGDDNSSLVSKAYAEGINIRTYPTTLQIRAESPSDVRTPLILENQSNQSIKMKVRFRVFNITDSQDGNVTYLNVGNLGQNPKVFDYIQVVDSDNTALDTIDLGPKQRKQLQLHIVVPPKQPASDNYFSLIFLHDTSSLPGLKDTNPNKKEQHSITTIQGGVATNVFLSIGDRETPFGSIEEFSTSNYHQAGPVAFNIKIKNSGLHYINPKGDISIKNVFGQTVGKVTIPSTTILAGTTRTLVDPTAKDSTMQDFTWKEKFLIGFYSAHLSLSMSEDGPTYEQNVRFAAFPIHLVAGLILVSGIITLVIIKLKKKKRFHKRQG